MRHRIGDAGFHWRHFGCLCISCQKNLYQFFRSHKNRCEVIGTVLFRWLLFCLGFESLWTPNYLLSLAIWERFCSLMCWRINLQQRAKYHVIIQTVDVELEMVASRPNGWRRQFLFNIRMFFFFLLSSFSQSASTERDTYGEATHQCATPNCGHGGVGCGQNSNYYTISPWIFPHQTQAYTWRNVPRYIWFFRRQLDTRNIGYSWWSRGMFVYSMKLKCRAFPSSSAKWL